MNEMYLIMQLVLFYGLLVVAYRLFGTRGLLCWTAIATIAANIEVLVMVDAFGMSMTLGNIMFATTFIVTDILSEVGGVQSKKLANSAVKIGVFASVAFILITQSWLLFTPSAADFAMPSIQTLFSNTPRLMLTGLVVYAVAQKFDVWFYHKIWALTRINSGNKDKYLWLRNNGSTLVSQALNSVLYTFLAFYGVFDTPTLISINLASYVIFIVTSLVDTPVIYFCRYMKNKGYIKENL